MRGASLGPTMNSRFFARGNNYETHRIAAFYHLVGRCSGRTTINFTNKAI